MGIVYLLHFDKPISPDHTTQHYLGYTSKTLRDRIARHRDGNGARLIEVAMERGIDFVVAKTWQGNKLLERKLKKCKCSPRMCPICKELKNA